MKPSNPDTGPQKYRKKPVVVEAIRYRGEVDKHLVRDFVTTPIDEVSGGQGLSLATLEGWLHVSEGDWIIRGVQGEFYPCKPDLFEKTYEPVYENRSGKGWVAGAGPVPTNPPAKPTRTPTAEQRARSEKVADLTAKLAVATDALADLALQGIAPMRRQEIVAEDARAAWFVEMAERALAKIEEGDDA
jgi:hypothetical protein